MFIKPELVIVYDRLQAKQESTFEYWLHATQPFKVADQHNIGLEVEDVHCDISLLAPVGLIFSQTDQYDPNPRPRITLREWHLTATTAEKAKNQEFIAVYRPHRADDNMAYDQKLTRIDGGYVLEATLSDGRITGLLPTLPPVKMSVAGLSSLGQIVIERRNANDAVIETSRLSPQ